MEVLGKSMVAVPTNVIYLSTILGQDGPNPVHKCDWKCENEHVCGNMFRCRLTGLTHICDKNCNQRILYDNHNSLCRVSRQIFPLTQVEVQAVKGVRRKFDADSSPSDSCAFKRRRDAHFHPSPFERSFTAIRALPRGLDFEQIESAISLELLNRDRSEEESNSCQINRCFVSTLKCDYPAVTLKDPFLLKVLDDDREVSRTGVLKISGSHQLCFAAAHFDFIRKATLADGEFAR